MKTAILILFIVAGVLLMALGGCDKNDGELKTVDPDGSPDLVVTKTVDLDGNRTPHEGAVIRYLVTVHNDGAWDALNVVVRDSLPAQVSFVAATADKGGYDLDSYLWDIGQVAADSTVSLEIVVTVNEATLGQVVSNTARVVAMSPEDDEMADNVATALFAVLDDPPLAGDDAYECLENGLLEVPAPGVLENDLDIENDPFDLVLEPVSEPWHGTVTLNADGSFEYQHDGAEAAVDSFTYAIRDEGGATDTGLVRLTILPVNDPPVGVEDFYQVAEAGTVSGNVLTNDDDPEDDPLTAILVEAPDHAANFGLAADGQFTYTHDGAEVPLDRFTYQASDGDALSEIVTVTLSVSTTNDPPVVSGIPDQDIDEGGTFAVIMLDGYVADPDHDDEELTWSTSGADELEVSINPTTHRCLVSTPGPHWFGAEIITFRATDPNGAWDEDQAIFEVRAVNDPPYIQPIPAQTVAEGGSFVPLLLDMFVNDPDDPDASLEWDVTGGDPYTVEIDEERRLLVTAPDADWNGQATLTLTVQDPGGLEDQRFVSFTVTPVNDAPVTTNLPDQTIQAGGDFLPISLDNFVSDVDNTDEQMIWTFSGEGELEVAISSQRVATVQVPNGSWTGAVTITFRATDPSGAWDETEATFTVVESLALE